MTTSQNDLEQSGRVLYLPYDQACAIFASCLEVRMALTPHDAAVFDHELFTLLPQRLAKSFARTHRDEIDPKKCHDQILQQQAVTVFEELPPHEKLSQTLTAINMTICRDQKQAAKDYFSDRQDTSKIREKFLEQMQTLCLNGKYDQTKPPMMISVFAAEKPKEKPLYKSLFDWSAKKDDIQEARELTTQFLNQDMVEALNKMYLPSKRASSTDNKKNSLESYLENMQPALAAMRVQHSLALKKTG